MTWQRFLNIFGSGLACPSRRKEKLGLLKYQGIFPAVRQLITRVPTRFPGLGALWTVLEAATLAVDSVVAVAKTITTGQEAGAAPNAVGEAAVAMAVEEALTDPVVTVAVRSRAALALGLSDRLLHFLYPLRD
jgi:hypothetical protein